MMGVGTWRAGQEKRSKLGRAIKVRHVPELRFAHDDSAAEGARMDELIRTALGPDGSK